MTELSLGHMAFVLFSTLRQDYPDQLYAILRAGTAIPHEDEVGAKYPAGLHVDDDGALTVLSLINSLLVALGEPRVAIACPTGPAGEVLPTVTDVLLIGPNDEVLYGDGEGGEAAEEDEIIPGYGPTIPSGPAPGGDSG